MRALVRAGPHPSRGSGDAGTIPAPATHLPRPSTEPTRAVIIDCHTHLNRYSDDDAPTLAERHARLLGEMDAHGVAHAMVLTSYLVNDRRPSTDEVLAVTERGGRLHVVAGVRCDADGPVELPRLRALLAEGRLRGLKLYPGYVPMHVHDGRYDAVYALAAEFGVPVMIHTGDTFDPASRVRFAHPLECDEVAVRHRETTIVLCHLGNPWFTDAMEVIYKNPNVLGDISGLTVGAFQPRFAAWAQARVRDVVAYVNDETRLMFGTDWPISDVGSYLGFVEGLGLTEGEREALLWRNAARVYGLEME